MEESFDKLFAAINGIVIPAPVEKKMREEFEGTKEKPTPAKNEEIRHTTSQTKKMTTRQPRACEPNRRHGGAGRRGGSTSTRYKMKKQNSNCYNFQNQ